MQVVAAGQDVTRGLWGALANEYQVYHVNTGGFRRFSETEIVEAARELALHFVERAGPR
jgi:hypothetical protein